MKNCGARLYPLSSSSFNLLRHRGVIWGVKNVYLVDKHLRKENHIEGEKFTNITLK